MKKIKSYFIIVCALSIIVFSGCKKDKDPEPVQPTPFAYSQDKLEKRWTVTNNNRTDGATVSTLIAVEFVGNAYILYFPNDSIVTGTYTTLGADVIILNKFGKLKVNTLSDTNFGFELEVKGTKEVFTSAKAVQAIPDSDYSKRLCRTWRLTEYTYAGVTQKYQGDVTFNKYGTYLTKFTQYGTTSIGTNTWMWSNTTGDEICYGAWDGGNITDCDGLGHVRLEFSTDGTKLTMIETDDYFGDFITYKLVLK